MPQGEGPPVSRVVLVCGHIRRHFDAVEKTEYFCLDCDDLKAVDGKLADPRAYQGNGTKMHPDRERYKR